ncbi:MAG: tetratricopeptide repeat protein [candidate division KSB1 bacterium]|nr:tetratricopeptide repeat protein [candidate division KSB1 bacterium]MDZ7318104.1 tetratricopeptide repeat protein [candidate division KSB1 bacterium]MDZ7340514.1 tetratricopeptide repeat protein [candidate division KSB1 bacterium]
MMETIGLNSEVVAGGKKFHVQTQFLESNEKIISNIFDDGKVIVTKDIAIGSRLSVRELKEQTERLHQAMISDLELLYFIAEKVRTVRHALSNNKLGLAFLKRNLFDEAMAEFERAVEIDPELTEAYLNWGRAYLQQNKFAEAIAIFSRALQKNPEYADLHNYLGYAHFRNQQLPEAAGDIKFALEKNPKYVEAVFNFCLVLLQSVLDGLEEFDHSTVVERLDRVKEFLTSIVDQRDYYKTDYLEQAIEKLNDDNIAEAMKSLEMADADRPVRAELDLESEFYLKFMFGGKGKDDEFIREYTQKLKQAVASRPDYADLRNNLGIAYLIQCRNLFLNALEEFREAIRINPDFKKAEKNLKLAENDGKGFLILLRAILK